MTVTDRTIPIEQLAGATPEDPSSMVPVLMFFEHAVADDSIVTDARRIAALAAKAAERIILGEQAHKDEALACLLETAADLLALRAHQIAPDAIRWQRRFETSGQERAAPSGQSPAGEAIPADLLSEFAVETAEHLDRAEADLLTVDRGGAAQEVVASVFRAFHTIKGAAGFLHLPDIARLSHEAENLLSAMRNGNVAMTGARAGVLLEVVDALRMLSHDARKAAQPNAALSARIDTLVASLASTREPAARDAATPAAIDQQRAAQRRAPAQDVLRVATEKVDELVDLVTELGVSHSMVFNSQAFTGLASADLQRQANEMQKTSRELHHVAMSLRMVTVQRLFQRMERAALDTARKTGKDVRIVTTGEDTELDRSLVEKLADPLIHLVRNAIDHGLEDPDARARAGKQAQGCVHLIARHEGPSVRIEIQDDGKGVPVEKVRAKAELLGLIAPGESLSTEHLLECICMEGFSTMDNVTEVSGRGVGLDVVRRSIDELKGKLFLTTTPGKGSRFSIALPLTLGAIDGILVRVGVERYVMPATAVERCLSLCETSVTTVNGKGRIITAHDALLPLWSAAALLGHRAERPEEVLVILRSEQDRFALAVDAVLGKQQVAIKGLCNYLGKTDGVSGGAIMPDGSVALILDPAGLARLAGRPA
jgi:two-component system chemotaxis sensor kinase CheA